MDEKRYTLEEAKREMARKTCAEGGHSPHHRIATYGNPIGVHYCECGMYKWTAEVR